MMRISRGPGDVGESMDSIRGNSRARARSDGCQIAETAHQTARAASSLSGGGRLPAVVGHQGDQRPAVLGPSGLARRLGRRLGADSGS